MDTYCILLIEQVPIPSWPMKIGLAIDHKCSMPRNKLPIFLSVQAGWVESQMSLLATHLSPVIRQSRVLSPETWDLHVVGRWKSCAKWPISIRDAEPEHRSLQESTQHPHAKFKCPWKATRRTTCTPINSPIIINKQIILFINTSADRVESHLFELKVWLRSNCCNFMWQTFDFFSQCNHTLSNLLAV